jgi:imidazolonepropionase-like amidohydrolase
MFSEPQTLIFDNILIFNGDDFIENSHVVVSNGRITQIGSETCKDMPGSATRVSGPGVTLIPGLIDSHVHGLFGNEKTIEQSLNFGVTTVLDMHNEPEHIAKLRKVRCGYSIFGHTLMRSLACKR